MIDIKNLGDLFAVHRQSDRTVIIDLHDGDHPHEVSYREFDASCNAVARALVKRGLKSGDRVGLISSNRLEFLEVFFGAMRAGFVPVPINIEVPKSTIEWIITDSYISLVFCGQRFAPLSPDFCEKIIFETDYEAFKDPGSFTAIVPQSDDIAFQPYTSESTGRPKGVLLLHKAHVWVSQTIARDRRISPADRMIVSAPLYHKNAMNAVKSVFVGGASLVLLPRFNARQYLNALHRYKATTLSGVPTIYAMLLRERELLISDDVSQVRLLTVGGAPASDPLIDDLAEIFPNAEIVQIFGITETSAALFGPHPEGKPRPRHSIGWPIAGNEFSLNGGVDDHEGVLFVRSPGMMLGYYNNAEETNRRLKDGWFETGDILRRDAEGWYYFIDRADDMFASGGNNIFPGQVETVLERHPGIHQAVVVPVPDELKHRLPYAFVVQVNGAGLTEEEVKNYVLKNAAPYMHPRKVFFVSDLPLTGAGKIDRKALIKRATDLAATPS